MCRISGIWDWRQQGYETRNVALRMRDSMEYGGPDDAGLYIDQENGLSLGHRRLSILDLSALGHQPMFSDDGRYCIVHNGEIYNFAEIRTELVKKGYSFVSASDTEVILNSFRCWETEAVHRFRGMFAFALWDKETATLRLFRDRAGVKPLYWYYRDGLFLFASELKALFQHPDFVKEIDSQSVASFLSHGFIPAPNTIFKRTHKLKPGHFLTINKNKEITITKYWDIAEYYARAETTRNNNGRQAKQELEVCNELERLCTESFSLRMISDVPVGLFLSGGIDSTLVATLLSRTASNLKTFSIGFANPAFDEAPHARKIAEYLGTRHSEIYCSSEDAAKIMGRLPDLFDEPFGDSSAIPTHLVAQLARRDVTVCLSGDGGDELFGGYVQYGETLKKKRLLHSWPQRNLLRILTKIITPQVVEGIAHKLPSGLRQTRFAVQRYGKFRSMVQEDDIGNFYSFVNRAMLDDELALLGIGSGYSFDHTIGIRDELHSMMISDFKNYLADDVLVKVDRATMRVALEAREPLLDNKLVEYVAQLPSFWKRRNGQSKYLLRRLLAQYLPKEYFDRPKRGFSIPLYDWLRKDFHGLLNEYLRPSKLVQEGIFQADGVEQQVRRYLKGEIKAEGLWYMLMLEMWWRRWMGSQSTL